MASRGMVALAFLLALVASSIAQDKHPAAGRISATFYPAQGAAQRSRATAATPDADKVAQPDRATMISPFKVDPEAPIHIEADSFVETSKGQAVFSGNVKLRQGGFLLSTATLTAFYLGHSGPRSGDEWGAEQLTRVEAEDRVLVTSKKGLRVSGQWATPTATGQSATFDVVANTLLLEGRVTLTRVGENIVASDEASSGRLKVDLTTGMSRFETGRTPASEQPANPTPRP
jgi:lipopolysaccharide export system protein LptA